MKNTMPKHNLRTDIEIIRPFIGIGLLIFSGVGFAISIIIVSIAIKSGIGVNTSNAVRFLVAVLTIFTYHKITKRPIKLPLKDRFTALSLGVTVFLVGLGYIEAIKYIPVSLTVLIFYTSPFLVVFISRITEKEPLTIIRLTAIGIAFLGLYLAIEVHFTNVLFDIKGVLFAFVAAIGMAMFVTISSLSIRTADPQAVNLHALSSGTLLFFFFLLIMDGSLDYMTKTNSLRLCSSGFVVGISHITFYAGLKIIGPGKASMLLNIEPIFTIVLSIMILGESLSIRQSLGAGLVILGIILINYKRQ